MAPNKWCDFGKPHNTVVFNGMKTKTKISCKNNIKRKMNTNNIV